MKRIEINVLTGESVEIDQAAYTDTNGLPVLLDVGAPSAGLTPITFEQYAILRAPPPPTKQQQIDQVLAVQGKGKDRLLLQQVIAFVESQAPALAAQYGVPLPTALLTLYNRNKSYRECKDTESAIEAIEDAP